MKIPKIEFISYIITDCKKKFQVEHGYVDFDQMDEARGEVPVVCHTGYKAKPHKTMICRADGTWSGARCAPRGCCSFSINPFMPIGIYHSYINNEP